MEGTVESSADYQLVSLRHCLCQRKTGNGAVNCVKRVIRKIFVLFDSTAVGEKDEI